MIPAETVEQFLDAPNNYVSIAINWKQVGVEEVKAIAKALRGNETITSIYLGSNQVGAEGAKALAEVLRENKTITLINLYNNQIGNEGARVLAESLNENETITSIDLGRNDIGADGARALADSLRKNKTITSVNLYSNQIGAGGAGALTEGLKINNTITSIDLGDNQIGDIGARALAESLKINTTIKSIHLYSNQIGDEGTIALAETLKVNKAITSIDLRNNQIGDAGAIAINNGLKDNSTLTLLYLVNNQISDEGIIMLEELNIPSLSISNQNPINKVIEIKQENAEEINDANHKLSIFLVDEKNNLDISAKETITKISFLLREDNQRLQGKNQQGILILGKTSFDKNMLAHLLASREMQATLDDKREITVADALQLLPNDLVMWNCPEFGDIDTIQEIVNAFYVRKLFENTKQLKFILVVSESEITYDGGADFLDTVTQVINNFNNIEVLDCSVLLVVTQEMHNSKQVQHVQEAIERMLVKYKHMEPATQQMIAFLNKSVQVLHTSIDKGRVTLKTDMLAAINNPTTYCNSELVQVDIFLSDEAAACSENLLQIVSHNFNEILKIILLAIAQPNIYIYEEDIGNMFMENYELIKSWIPSSMQYQLMERDWGTPKCYFVELDHLKDLLNTFKTEQVGITTFEEGLEIINQSLRVFEKFYINRMEEGYAKILQEYAYVLSQQFEYIKFFSDMCQKGLPSIDRFIEVIKYCQGVLEDNLKQQIKILEIDENISDRAYYIKAIEYLNMYADDPACESNKARAHIKLNNIDKNENINGQVLQYDIDDKKAEIYDEVIKELAVSTGLDVNQLQILDDQITEISSHDEVYHIGD